jgi:hypothetical protein
MYPVNSIVRIKQAYRDRLQTFLQKNPDDTKWGNGYYHGFLRNNLFVYLGEIQNQAGHGIYAGMDGKVYWGFDTDDFELRTDKEIKP